MGEVIPLEDPLNYRRVMQRIKKLWTEGNVEIIPHAQDQMKDRGLDTLDLQHVIRYGRITEHSRPGDLWRYKVVGTSVDAGWAACVVEIAGHLIIVTAIGARKRKR